MPMDTKTTRPGPLAAAMALAVAFFCLGAGHAHAIDESTAGGLTRLPLTGGAGSISAEGDRVAGWHIDAKGNRQAFRWSAAEGIVRLGPASVRTSSHAHAISADGMSVVGCMETLGKPEATRWTPGGATAALGYLPGGERSTAYAASANGSTVVGEGDSAEGHQAFRWTAATGMEGLGFLPGSFHCSAAYGVSADGSVIVGESASEAGGQAFRWTAADGMVGLGWLAGVHASCAKGVSADGKVVVGVSGGHPFRWTKAGGMAALCGEAGCANAVSHDGSVIVGWRLRRETATTHLGKAVPQDFPEAFVWDQTNGMRAIHAIVDPSPTHLAPRNALENALGISADGTTMVGDDRLEAGTERDSHPWILRLGKKPSHPQPEK